jgi:hypothetical protein
VIRRERDRSVSPIKRRSRDRYAFQ